MSEPRMGEGRMSGRLQLDRGEPDCDTPAHIVAAGVHALQRGSTRYVAPEGIPELRGAVAEHLRAMGIPAAMERVVISAGAKPILGYALRAILSPGDEVLVPDPGYPGYRAAVELARGVATPYPLTDAEGRFAPDVSAMEACITPRTRVIVINSPHNPTGGVMDAETLDAIAELALRHDLYVLSDEVYSAIVFGAESRSSIASRPGMDSRTIVVNSFSKTYAMTGWRLGYAHLPASLVAPVRELLLHSATCTPPFVQEAGVAALTEAQSMVQEMVRTYSARRDAMVTALRSIPGVSVHVPDGAFYVFPRFHPQSRVGSSAAMAKVLLVERDLACVSGALYGSAGEGCLRLSFAVSSGVMDEAARRLRSASVALAALGSDSGWRGQTPVAGLAGVRLR